MDMDNAQAASEAVKDSMLTKAERKALKRAAKQSANDVTAERIGEAVEESFKELLDLSTEKTTTVSTVLSTTPQTYATLCTIDEEREHALNRAVAAVLLTLPSLSGIMANVRFAVHNISSKIGKGWKVDVASDGTGMVTIDGRINAGRAALARALFGTIYAYTGYDSRELRKLAEQVGFVFGKGRATGWSGDMTPELAKSIDDVLSGLPEYPQRFQFEQPKGRTSKGSKNATLNIAGSPTGDDKINGNVHGGRVFIAQLAADMAKAGYWVSIEDKETDAVLSAAATRDQATQDNEINKALAA